MGGSKVYFDWTYIILVLPAVIFALWASARVNSAFAKYSKQRVSCGMTGAQAARMILDTNGLTDVRIERVSGNLTDHYDPRSKTVRLSEGVYDAATTAAIGVAAHECGHAVQDAQDYAPLRIRNAIVPITNIGSQLAMPLILIGILFSYAGSMFTTIAYVGVACFALSALFQLITLPTEFNASNRAIAALQSDGALSGEELAGSRRVLSAAALTYVAALAVSLMQLLRLLLLVRRSDRD